MARLGGSTLWPLLLQFQDGPGCWSQCSLEEALCSVPCSSGGCQQADSSAGGVVGWAGLGALVPVSILFLSVDLGDSDTP